MHLERTNLMSSSFVKSIQKNKKGLLLMLVSSVCVCIGQLLWKLSADRGLLVLLLGFLFYGVGAIVMIVAYRFGKVSVLQPMLSINYVLSILLAAVVLNENITILKSIGVVAVTMGVALIAGGDNE